MYIKIVTTITSEVPINDDGFGSPDHSIDIDCDTDIPNDAIFAVALGGARSTAKALSGKLKVVGYNEDDFEDED